MSRLRALAGHPRADDYVEALRDLFEVQIHDQEGGAEASAPADPEGGSLPRPAGGNGQSDTRRPSPSGA